MNSANVTWLADLAVAQLWQVSLLVVLVGVLSRTVCRRQPHLAYLLWLVVLAKCLAPPVASSRLSPFSWLLAERSAPLAAAPAVLPAINLAAESATAEVATAPQSHPIAQPSPAAPAIPATSNGTIAAIALGVWAIGVAGFAAFVLAKNLQLRSAIRNASEPSDDLARQLASLVARLALRRSPNLVVTAEPLGPLVFGVVRPTIVLPGAALESFDGQRRAAADLEPVLAHEVVHVRRGDTIVGLLQTLAQIGWWFHPVVWWANREMRRERERACDEEVVAGLACPPTHYARSLLAVLEAAPCRRSAWAPAGMPMLSFTAQRLTHLVRESATFRKRMPLGYWFVAALLMVLLLPGAGLSLEAPPAGKATDPKLLLRDMLENREALFDPGSDRAHLGSPTISPDGRRVVFSLPQPSGQQLVSIDMQAGDRRNLTDTAGINDWPVFSPDGNQLAFGSSRDGDFEIHIMAAGGGDARRLTHCPGIDLRPAWSPDGQRIAFTSLRDGNYELYAVGVDGGRLTRLTEHAERDDYAQWHPDGRQLAWIAERDGEFDVYLQRVAP